MDLIKLSADDAASLVDDYTKAQEFLKLSKSLKRRKMTNVALVITKEVPLMGTYNYSKRNSPHSYDVHHSFIKDQLLTKAEIAEAFDIIATRRVRVATERLAALGITVEKPRPKVKKVKKEG
jgi:hypothetical protein